MTDASGGAVGEEKHATAVHSRPSPVARYGGMAAMVLGAAFAFAATILSGGAAGRSLGAIAVGLLFAASYRTWLEATVLSAIAGACGAGLAIVALKFMRPVPTPEAVQSFADIYGAHANASVVGNVGSLPLFVLWAVLVSTVVALVAGFAIQFSPKRKLARVFAAALVVACTFGSMWAGATSDELNQFLRQPPAAGTFRQDAFIFWHAYVNVTKSEPYYAALRDGAADDSAIIDNHYIVDGKFTGWALSPASIRLPYPFYLWRYLAPGGGTELLVVALVFAGMVLAASLWALMPRIGPAAALVPMLLMPYLQVSLVFGGLFLPDVWAALFVTLAFFAWIRERYVVAGAFMLAGALCRETAIFALLILLAWTAWRALRREREWVVRAIALAGMTAVFALAYWLHLRAGAAYVSGTQSAGGTVAQMLGTSAGRSFSAKFLNPTEFGSFIYMLLFLPSWLPLGLQFPGWYLALRRSNDALVPVLAFAAFWVVFTATFGATSAYWGVMYMPLAIAGSGVLLAWAGMRGQQTMRPRSRAGKLDLGA